MNWIAKNNLFPVAVFLLAIVVLLGCTKKEADPEAFDPAKLPREKTLYISGFQWGAPSSFNPLAITPAWPITGNINLVYQALFGYDLLSGEIKPIIGKSYRLQDKVLQINCMNLHSGRMVSH